MRDELAILADRSLSTNQLIMLRMTAENLRLGLLDVEQAQRTAYHISAKFEGVFDAAVPQENTSAAAALVADAVENVLRTRTSGLG